MRKNLKWSYENVRLEALKYKTRTEFARGSVSAYTWAVYNKWLAQVTTHMPDQANKWTTKELQEEALKYSSRVEFRIKSKAAYTAAWRRDGCLDKICSHMPSPLGTKIRIKNLTTGVVYDSLSAASRALKIHKNTLYYRLIDNNLLTYRGHVLEVLDGYPSEME